MKLTDIRDLFLSIGVPAYHFFADKQEGKYLVWAENGQGRMNYGDDEALSQALSGTLEYFTDEEYDPNFMIIQDKLNKLDGWHLDFIRWENAPYEEGKNQIHYGWTWQALVWHAYRSDR